RVEGVRRHSGNAAADREATRSLPVEDGGWAEGQPRGWGGVGGDGKVGDGRAPRGIRRRVLAGAPEAAVRIDTDTAVIARAAVVVGGNPRLDEDRLLQGAGRVGRLTPRGVDRQELSGSQPRLQVSEADVAVRVDVNRRVGVVDMAPASSGDEVGHVAL